MSAARAGRTLRPIDPPIADERYPQKHTARIRLPGGREANDVRAVATAARGVWCATGGGLFCVKQTFETEVPLGELPPEWEPPAIAERCEVPLPSDIRDVRFDERGRLWVAALDGIACLAAGEWRVVWRDTLDLGFGAVMSLLVEGDEVWAVTSEGGVGRVREGRFEPLALPRVIGRPLRLDRAPGGIWISAARGAALVAPNGMLRAVGLEGRQVRRALWVGERTYFATDRGLAVHTGEGFAHLPERCPVSDLHDLAIGPDGTLWAATPRGVWRAPPAGGRVHYYAGRRYVPHPYCRALAPSPWGMWVGTAAGLAHLAELPMTLAEKAERFERRVHARHWRLDGYVTSSRLHRPGDLGSSEPWPSDNDGLWTAMYLAAQAYRWAATGAPEARRQASRAFSALERLESITTVPGFPTKAIVPKGHPEAMHGSVPWYPSADGEWLWKGDCSSDEIVGHFYGYALFYDLAASPDERARVRALVDRIMGHILDHGFFLVGPDGRPTRWGVWAP
ncbi:MAG TPA: hypothetical protein VF234_03400, partial [Limnochordia bacterium]